MGINDSTPTVAFNESHTENAALQRRPTDFLSVLDRAIQTPGMTVDIIERMLAVQERIVADQRKIAFMEAMARLQAKLPQINKYGQAKNNKFAKLEDIDIVIRPLLSEDGFSFSFDEVGHTDKTVTFVARISHQAGHYEEKKLTVPIDAAASNRDGKAIRPAIQDYGSTVSYARRYLLKMTLNLIEKNEDTDGENLQTISADQAKDIEVQIQDLHVNLNKFLEYMGVTSIDQILVRDLVKVKNAFDVKRKAQK